MKLISTTEFLLERYEAWVNDNNPDLQASARYIYRTSNYAKLLEKYLKLEMFVPCDAEGDVLTKSTMSENTCEDDCNHKNCVLEMNECIKYQQAEKKVLFEGWYFDAEADDFIYLKNKDLMLVFNKLSNEFELIGNDSYIIETVEDLVKFDLTLTKSVINKLGL